MAEKRRIVKAGAWVISGKLLARLFDLALLLILSRILVPSDFGLLAIAMAPIFIGEALLELPLVQALIRFKNPTKPMYDTAFTLSVLRGLALGLILLSLAWPLAAFYSDPRLAPLVCVLALGPALRGTVSPRLVTFMKDMDFTREFALDVAGKIVAFMVGTSIALSTKSYWAIAAASITTPLVMNVLSYIFAPYRPAFTLSEWKKFADMIGWNSVSQILSALNWQMDRLLLGRFVPTDILGRYSLADDLIAIPFRSLVAPLVRPIMVNFTEQEQQDGLGKAYLNSVNAVVLGMAPILISMAFLAQPIVFLVLGMKWAEAVPLIKWIAIVGLLSLPTRNLAPLALSLDRTRNLAIQMAVEFFVKLPATIIGVIYYGVWGAIAARALASAFVIIATMFIVRNLISVSIIRQTMPLIKVSMATALMSAVLWASRPVFDFSVPPDKLILIAHSAVCCALSFTAYLFGLFVIWILSGRPDGVERYVLDWAKDVKTRIRH